MKSSGFIWNNWRWWSLDRIFFPDSVEFLNTTPFPLFNLPFFWLIMPPQRQEIVWKEMIFLFAFSLNVCMRSRTTWWQQFATNFSPTVKWLLSWCLFINFFSYQGFFVFGHWKWKFSQYSKVVFILLPLLKWCSLLSCFVWRMTMIMMALMGILT